jgi:hypothetical protein
MDWATLWAIFSQTHMVTLILKPDKETLQFPVFDPLHIFDIF